MNSLINQKKRAVFAVDGGNGIGFGHISRCMSLIRALPCDWVGVLWGGENFSFPESIDKNMYVKNLGLVEKIDVLFLDPIKISQAELKEIKRQHRCIIVALDNFDFANPLIDLFVNLFNRGLSAPDHCYEGLEFAIINDKFIEYKISQQAEPSEEYIVVMLGGEDPNNLTSLSLQHLEKNFPHTLIVVVLGPYNKNEPHINLAADNISNPVKVIKVPSNLPEIMGGAMFAVSGCSTSFFEFAYLGINTVIVSQNKAEHLFASWLEKQHLTSYQNNDLEKSIRVLKSYEYRVGTLERIRTVFNGDGVRRVLSKAGIGN